MKERLQKLIPRIKAMRTKYPVVLGALFLSGMLTSYFLVKLYGWIF
jgi:hypothetical protein